MMNPLPKFNVALPLSIIVLLIGTLWFQFAHMYAEAQVCCGVEPQFYYPSNPKSGSLAQTSISVVVFDSSDTDRTTISNGVRRRKGSVMR